MVELKSSPDGDDYINANFCPNQSRSRVHLLSESILRYCSRLYSLPCVKVILQLCQLMKNGKDEYYPKAGAEYKTYSFVQVRVLDRNSNVAGMHQVEDAGHDGRQTP